MSRINTAPCEFLQARADAAERIERGRPEPKAPKALPWQGIATEPEIFQHRRIDADTSAAHMQTLARAIQRGPRGARQAALEPITVFWLGDAWVCVDGHHRLAAYRWVKHPAPVPVKALRGATLGEAIKVSLAGNSKDKLELSKRCKTEAAWRFTVAGGLSKAEIAALADVDESTIAAMRRTLRKFPEKHPGADPAAFTWAHMRMLKLPPSEEDDKGEEQRAAEKLLRRTERHLKGISPRVLLLALGLHSAGLVAELFALHQAADSDAYAVNPFPEVPELSPEF